MAFPSLFLWMSRCNLAKVFSVCPRIKMSCFGLMERRERWSWGTRGRLHLRVRATLYRNWRIGSTSAWKRCPASRKSALRSVPLGAPFCFPQDWHWWARQIHGSNASGARCTTGTPGASNGSFEWGTKWEIWEIWEIVLRSERLQGLCGGIPRMMCKDLYRIYKMMWKDVTRIESGRTW